MMLAAIENLGSITPSHYIITIALPLVSGLIGFVRWRHIVVRCLVACLMFPCAVCSVIAFGRFHLNASGQVFVIFILTVAAAEAALALALVVLLYRRRETLSAEVWSELTE